MERFRTALLAAAALGAGMPSLASAQAPDRPNGEQRGDRGQGERRGGQPQQPAAQPQAQVQPQGQAQVQPRPQQQPRPQSGGGGTQSPQQARQSAPPAQQAQQAHGYQNRRDGGGFDRGRGNGDRGGPGRGDRPEGFGQPGGNGQPASQGQRGFVGGRDDRRQSYNQQAQGYPGGGYRGGDQRFAGAPGRDDRRAGGSPGRVGGDWRGDRRYDWHGYRDQHREVFRAGRYVPPRAYYNYGYRLFDIGIRLDPFFYASNYWIDDPSAYRLPPVWGSYRWVRYYNDVLLVDLASGEVVDVIHDFFW